jgi:hypothetical protein
MSDRPFTELLDRLEAGDVLDPLEIKCLIIEGRSYVRMLRQADELFESHCEICESDIKIISNRVESLKKIDVLMIKIGSSRQS